MKFIATDVDDSPSRLQAMVAEQQQRPGFAMDRYFYRSHVTYQRELDMIVFRSWLYAAHVSEIPEHGDYVLLDVGEEQLIIVRGTDDRIRALHNTCRHRGARVCEEQQGNRKSFVCPYHGWVYETSGKLKAARQMEVMPDFDRSEFGLRQARVAVRFGLIFVNFNQQASDFEAALAQVDVQLGAYRLDQAKIAHRHTYKVDANWKLVVENYLECYHCANAHRSYARMHTLKDRRCDVAHLKEAMLQQSEELTGISGLDETVSQVYREAPGFGACIFTERNALYEGFKSGTRSGEPAAPFMGQFKGADGGCSDFQLGPLSFMLNYPDHCVMYRFVPRGLTSTDMEIIWFVNADAVEGRDYDRDTLSWLWHRTTLEDEYIITRNSEGVNSQFFEPGPYHAEFEWASILFVDWYLAALAGEFEVRDQKKVEVARGA